MSMSAVLSAVRIKSWRGLQTNRDAREVDPGGSTAQENVCTNVPGKLAVRLGVQAYTFETSATIYTGWNTFRRACFCRSRFGDLFIVNGLNTPLRWDGMTATAEEAGIRAPVAAPTVAVAAGGGATAGSYDCYMRYIDNTLPDPIPGNLSPVATVVAVALDKFNWTVPIAVLGRASSTELWRSTAYDPLVDAQPNVIYKIATLAAGVTSFTGDTFTDAQLLDSEDEDTLKILLEDGSLNANRFVPPPNDRPIMVMFQDRYWYAGQVNYNLGTVTTAGGTGLTGAGTGWNGEMDGRFMRVYGEPAPLNVGTIGGATTATLSTSAVTSGGSKQYVIYSDPSFRRKILFSEVDEPESVPTTNVITLQESTGDEDEITGLIPRGAYLYVMTDRARYALSFARQPRIDANVSLIDKRGLVNQFCWSSFDDYVFCLDDMGPYLFSGSARSEPIDADVHNYWRDGTIDQTKRDKFFVQVDREQERVYYFVCFTGDSSDLPTRALVYNVRTATWDHFTYAQQMGGGALAKVDGRTRMFLASESSTVHLTEEATTDVAAAEHRGTATSSGNTSITDTGASFTSDLVGAWVYIYEGTGKGQARKISSLGTTLLRIFGTWTTNPDTTSKYIAGCIPWTWRSGRMPLANLVQEGQRQATLNERSVRVSFPPTEDDYRMDLRLRWNYDDDPETHKPITHHQGHLNPHVEKANPTDIVIRMQADDTDLSERVGYEYWRFDGRLVDRSYTDRALQIELRGVQGDEQIELDELSIVGVTSEEQ
jgi:hypothetical protein